MKNKNLIFGIALVLLPVFPLSMYWSDTTDLVKENSGPNDTAASIKIVASTNPCTDALGGNVFNDFNNDGADAGASEVGQSNVLVEVYECDNNVPVATTYTNADGDWSVDDTNITYPVRVDFSTPLQDYLQPGIAGINNGTNVQFVEAPTCQVNYGVLAPSTYCGEDVSLVTTCYLGGDNTGGQAAILAWSYDNVCLLYTSPSPRD